MKKKRKLGILTFSDGRKRVHKEFLDVNQRFLDRLVKALKGTEELELVVGSEIIHTASQAKTCPICGTHPSSNLQCLIRPTFST